MTAAATTQLEAGTWTIDPVHSSISFSVRHLVVSKIRGNFEKFSGAIEVAEDGAASVSAEIAVDSVHTGNEQRDATSNRPISSRSRRIRPRPSALLVCRATATTMSSTASSPSRA
jgi:hypothetical protein